MKTFKIFIFIGLLFSCITCFSQDPYQKRISARYGKFIVTQVRITDFWFEITDEKTGQVTFFLSFKKKPKDIYMINEYIMFEIKPDDQTVQKLFPIMESFFVKEMDAYISEDPERMVFGKKLCRLSYAENNGTFQMSILLGKTFEYKKQMVFENLKLGEMNNVSIEEFYEMGDIVPDDKIVKEN